MIYTELTKLAMEICIEKHKGQYDRSKLPYVFHPFHVAESMTDENTTCAALLHDVMEDTDTTAGDLLAVGIPQVVVEALKLLTHAENEDYLAYVERAGHNPIARAVKISDLKHNSDLTRLDKVTTKDLERVAKYKKALAILGA